MTLLIGLAIRSAVMLAAGLVLSACLAKRSAALRHRVLAGSLAAAVVVMPFSLALPAWHVTLPDRAIVAPGPAFTLAPAAPDLAAAMPAEAPAPASAAPQPPAPVTASPIVIAWIAGMLVCGAWLMAGLIRVRRVAARASPVKDDRWTRALETVTRLYGLRRQVTIARTDSAGLLATWGIVRPQVLLPHHSHDWPPDRVHVVLCHELAHIRRHDWPVQMLAEALRAILWFNPLAWMICTRLRRESEQACDDDVLAMGVGGVDYAGQLLDLARQCRRPRSTWASALPMAHPSTLERRITAMLNPRLDRQAPSRRALAIVGAALLIITLPVAALRARQAGPATLTGTIFDVTGGVIPGAEVALLDAKEAARTARSNSSGRFEFTAVPPGKYEMRATLPGFHSLRQEIELGDARDWTRAITLQVGDLRETVTIQASRVPAPAPGTGPAAPVRVGGAVRQPQKVFDVKPTYPASMREAGLGGTVPIEAIIGRDGAVSSVRVLTAQVHPDLAAAAAGAVRKWRYTPTLLNNVPVEVVMTVTIRFNIAG